MFEDKKKYYFNVSLVNIINIKYSYFILKRIFHFLLTTDINLTNIIIIFQFYIPQCFYFEYLLLFHVLYFFNILSLHLDRERIFINSFFFYCFIFASQQSTKLIEADGVTAFLLDSSILRCPADLLCFDRSELAEYDL